VRRCWRAASIDSTGSIASFEVVAGSAEIAPFQGSWALLAGVVRGSGRRIRLLLVVAVAALVSDQAGKLVAAAVHPADYVHNPSLRVSVWPGLAMALGVFLLPYRPLVAAIGLSLGGGLGNLLDHYLWPGGTPDFISVSWLFPDAIWNPADLLIVIGTIGVGLALLVWPVHVGLRQWRQSASALS
jgi:hypothetical protein